MNRSINRRTKLKDSTNVEVTLAGYPLQIQCELLRQAVASPDADDMFSLSEDGSKIKNYLIAVALCNIIPAQVKTLR